MHSGWSIEPCRGGLTRCLMARMGESRGGDFIRDQLDWFGRILECRGKPLSIGVILERGRGEAICCSYLNA